MVSCWSRDVSREMRLDTGLGVSSVGSLGLRLEGRENGRGAAGVRASACSKTALMLWKRELALRWWLLREVIGSEENVGL